MLPSVQLELTHLQGPQHPLLLRQPQSKGLADARARSPDAPGRAAPPMALLAGNPATSAMETAGRAFAWWGMPPRVLWKGRARAVAEGHTETFWRFAGPMLAQARHR